MINSRNSRIDSGNSVVNSEKSGINSGINNESRTRSKIARNLAFNKVKKFTSNLMISENSFCKYITSWLQNKKNLCKIYYDKLNIDNFIFFMQIINFFYFERNFQYLQCSDLDKILHGGSPWYWVPPVKILCKSVNFKWR